MCVCVWGEAVYVRVCVCVCVDVLLAQVAYFRVIPHSITTIPPIPRDRSSGYKPNLHYKTTRTRTHSTDWYFDLGPISDLREFLQLKVWLVANF